MNILVIDDITMVVMDVCEDLVKAGLRATGLVVGKEGSRVFDPETGFGHNAGFVEGSTILKVVEEADVIFLDHEMPSISGEEMLRWWKESGIDLSDKTIIGTSSLPQPYLDHKVVGGGGFVWTLQELELL